MTRNKPILCVDFDGVIHSYTSPWTDEMTISDPPVKGAIKWLWTATEWFDVQVYSSRSKNAEARDAMLLWLREWASFEMDSEHPMVIGDPYPITFAAEKPAAFLTIDDRALTFDGDWSELDPADLLNFKPWNKRQTGATGTFPYGHLNDDDQGALKIAVAYDKLDGIVRVDFGKPVAWLGLPKDQTIAFARALLKHAGASKVEITL
jgi:hypothetical protein